MAWESRVWIILEPVHSEVHLLVPCGEHVRDGAGVRLGSWQVTLFSRLVVESEQVHCFVL